jgi:hypothetical protein
MLTLKGFWMRFQNARLHNSKKSNEYLTELRAGRLPLPAYNQNLAPSDFFLFGTVKTELSNYEIHSSRQDLILTIRAIFDETPEDIFNSVSVSWTKRFKRIIKDKRKYFSN